MPRSRATSSISPRRTRSSLGERAIEDDDVAARVLHERAHRRDADAAGDERNLVAAARRLGEHAEGALGEDARADRNVGERRAVVAERLHRDTERPAVRRGRERERMRGPPASAREEAPREELARGRVQPVEPPAGDPDRHHARPLGRNLDDAQPMTECRRRRQEEAEHDEDRERGGVQRAPVVGGDGVEHELVPGGDLVEPAERDPGVGEEMHRVPPLVPQAAADDDVRRGDDREQEARADRGGDHPGVDPAAEHRRDLLADRELVHQRIAPDAEEHVRDDEVDGRVAVPPMPHGEAVEADEALERGQAREEDHLDERHVRTQEAGDPGDARERLPGRGRTEIAAVGPQPDDPRGVPEHHRPDEDEPDRPAGTRPSGCARRVRDRHLGHGAHSSNGF